VKGLLLSEVERGKENTGGRKRKRPKYEHLSRVKIGGMVAELQKITGGKRRSAVGEKDRKKDWGEKKLNDR